MLPPACFVERGFMEKGTYYLPQEVVYGLRRPPWLWNMPIKFLGMEVSKSNVRSIPPDDLAGLLP